MIASKSSGHCAILISHNSYIGPKHEWFLFLQQRGMRHKQVTGLRDRSARSDRLLRRSRESDPKKH